MAIAFLSPLNSTCRKLAFLIAVWNFLRVGRHFISGDFLGIPASLLFFLIKGCLGIFTRFHNEDLADFLIGDLAIFFGMVNLGLDLGGVLGILAELLSGCSLSIGLLSCRSDPVPRS